MRRRIRALLASVLALPMLAIVPTLAAEPAAAEETGDPIADLTCAFAGDFEWNPGVGLLPQPQKIFGVVKGGTKLSPATPCTSLTGVPYQGWTVKLTGDGNMGCTTALLAGGMSGGGTLTWDNGDTSTVEWSLQSVALVPIVNFTITGGALAGTSVLPAPVVTSFSGNCALTPFTHMGIAGVSELLKL